VENIDNDGTDELREIILDGAKSLLPTSLGTKEEIGVECEHFPCTLQNIQACDNVEEISETSCNLFCCRESSRIYEAGNARDGGLSPDSASGCENSVNVCSHTRYPNDDLLTIGPENIELSFPPQKIANLDSDGVKPPLDINDISPLLGISHITEFGQSSEPLVCLPETSIEVSDDVAVHETSRGIESVEDDSSCLNNNQFNISPPMAIEAPIDAITNLASRQSDSACLNTKRIGNDTAILSSTSENLSSHKDSHSQLVTYADIPPHFDSNYDQTEENSVRRSTHNSKLQLNMNTLQTIRGQMKYEKVPSVTGELNMSSHQTDAAMHPRLDDTLMVEQTPLFENQSETRTQKCTRASLIPVVSRSEDDDNTSKQDHLTSDFPLQKERPRPKNHYCLLGIIIALIISSTIFIIAISPRKTSPHLLVTTQPPSALRSLAPTTTQPQSALRSLAPTSLDTNAPGALKSKVSLNVWTKVWSVQNNEARDEAGHSLSMTRDGNRIVIGAMRHSHNDKIDIGAVRTYDLMNGNDWMLVDEQWGEYKHDQYGASVSISGDGKKLAVGAPGYDLDNEDSNVGKVYFYNIIDHVDDSSGIWAKSNHIQGNETGGQLGFSVSFDPNGYHLAIGAPHAKNQTGIVLIYMFAGNSTHGQWYQVGLSLLGLSTFDNFGSSVSLSADGKHLAVGAPGRSGYVNVYNFNTEHDGWHLQTSTNVEYANETKSFTLQRVDDNSIIADYEFGYSISISSDGTKLAVGAPGFDATTDNSNEGRVYLYNIGIVIDGSTNLLIEYHNITGDDEGAQLGSSVSFSSHGYYLAIGSPNAFNGKGSAQVLILSGDTGNPERIGDQIHGISPLDLFGSSVSLSGTGKHLTVGAPDPDASNGGYVSHFNYYTNDEISGA